MLAVWDAFGRFLEAARRGEGPLLLECLTHRLRGHYEGDPAKYREAIAQDEWQRVDPVLRLGRHAVAEGWLGEDDVAAIEAGAVSEVEAAVEFARESPFPDEALIEELVYAEGEPTVA